MTYHLGGYGYGLGGFDSSDDYAAFSELGDFLPQPVTYNASPFVTKPVSIGALPYRIDSPEAPPIPTGWQLSTPQILTSSPGGQGITVVKPSTGVAWAGFAQQALNTFTPIIQNKFGGAGQPQAVGPGVTYYPPGTQIDPATGAAVAVAKGAGGLVEGFKNWVSNNTGTALLIGGATALLFLKPPRRGRG